MSKPEKTQELCALDEEFLSKLRPSKSVSVPKGSDDAGIISIINSKNNGKRVSLSSELLSQLGMPTHVQVSFLDTELVIGEVLPNSDQSFLIKKSGAKGVLYAAQLVDEICEVYNLDFDNKTSQTFHNVRYALIDNHTVAIIKMIP